MARTKNNCITYGTSGKLGNLLFTSDGNMRSKPNTSNRVWSPLQIVQQNRFASAKEYARMAISDPELNAFYAAKARRKHGLGAWHLAISDYCHPPKISSAYFQNFKGKPGDEVRIMAFDDFQLTEVRVSFAHATGIFEEGSAQLINFGTDWLYRMKSSVVCSPGLTVTIQARGLPGNVTAVTLEWPFDCRNEILFSPDPGRGAGKRREKSQLRER
ncbi:MAG: hypothetical protein NT040_16100 [Bacteroidetes bacterium]|nr:hypothetical protein [Bacteroidota bacterium]